MSMALRISILGACLILASNHDAKAQTKYGQVEGTVQDQNGKPVKGVLVYVDQGSYTTQGSTTFIPLTLPQATGSVVIHDPTAVNTHAVSAHYVKSDAKGHFRFKLYPGAYSIHAKPFKKSPLGKTCNVKLLKRYEFPAGDNVSVEAGKTTPKDFVLQKRSEPLVIKAGTRCG